MLKRHPRLAPFVATRAHRQSAGLDVPLVDEAGKVHVVTFELGAVELVTLAGSLVCAAAALLQHKAHETAMSAASACRQVLDSPAEDLDLGINLKKV